MAIKIIQQPDVFVTENDLAAYRADYKRDYSYYAGVPPTFEEYVRRRQSEQRDAETPSGS